MAETPYVLRLDSNLPANPNRLIVREMARKIIQQKIEETQSQEVVARLSSVSVADMELGGLFITDDKPSALEVMVEAAEQGLSDHDAADYAIRKFADSQAA